MCQVTKTRGLDQKEIWDSCELTCSANMDLMGFSPSRNMSMLKHFSAISCFEGAAAVYPSQKWHFVFHFQSNFHHSFETEGSLDKNFNDFLFVCLFV